MSDSTTIQIFQSRSGARSAAVDGRLLYSRYNPVEEVRRFVKRTLSQMRYSSVDPILLVSDGFGYLETAVHELAPSHRVLSIHLSSELSRRNSLDRARICCPEDGCDPGVFVSRHVAADELEHLVVIEWPPAREAFRNTYRRVAERIRQVLRRTVGNRATVARWGQLWVRNILTNVTRYKLSSRLPHFQQRPALVLCSGPSLSATLGELIHTRELPVIIAVSSTLSTLRAYGIFPDLVVHTDAGFYSTLHFPRDFTYLKQINNRTPYVIPLTAAPFPGPPWPARVHTISGNSMCEQVTATALGLHPHTLPEAGTVSATALRLSELVTNGPRFIAGLDLAAKDIEQHARPHSFDPYIFNRSTRLHPELTMRLSRSISMYRTDEPWRRAANLDIYAQWFADHHNEFGTVRRIHSNNVTTGMAAAGITELRQALTDWATQTGNTPAGVTASNTEEPGAGTSETESNSVCGRDIRRTVLQAWKGELGRNQSANLLLNEFSQWLGCSPNIPEVTEILSELGGMES